LAALAPTRRLTAGESFETQFHLRICHSFVFCFPSIVRRGVGQMRSYPKISFSRAVFCVSISLSTTCDGNGAPKPWKTRKITGENKNFDDPRCPANEVRPVPGAATLESRTMWANSNPSENQTLLRPVSLHLGHYAKICPLDGRRCKSGERAGQGDHVHDEPPDRRN
jgi:hypothetical protein